VIRVLLLAVALALTGCAAMNTAGALAYCVANPARCN
jgi:hypothetical protein